MRKELVVSDAKQIAKTISRDLIYPIALLNGLTTSWSRCPRFKFDTTEPEDMAAFATAMPVFVDLGMKIKRQWAQEKLGIPEPDEGEEILQRAASPQLAVNNQPQVPQDPKVALTSLQPKPTLQTQLDDQLQVSTDLWVKMIKSLVENAQSLEDIRDGIEKLLPNMKLEQYAAVMGEALRVAELTGRADIMDEIANAS